MKLTRIHNVWDEKIKVYDMKNREYFWTMKNDEKINVDNMTESHLRNVLKLIIRRSEEVQVSCNDNTPFCDDWMWK